MGKPSQPLSLSRLIAPNAAERSIERLLCRAAELPDGNIPRVIAIIPLYYDAFRASAWSFAISRVAFPRCRASRTSTPEKIYNEFTCAHVLARERILNPRHASRLARGQRFASKYRVRRASNISQSSVAFA